MRRLLLSACLIATACGSSTSPAAPTPHVPREDVPTGVSTVSGRLTATNGGQALSAASVAVQGASATTDSAGAFSLTVPAAPSLAVTISGADVLTRGLFVNTAAPRSVSLDAIRQDGAFDLAFYRQLVRNGFEAPSTLAPLRRWLEAPKIYLKTVNEAGAAISAVTLAITEDTITSSAALWTGGRFSVASFERGTDTRRGIPGWITVRWPVSASSICGQAGVGESGGAIDLWIRSDCGCPTSEVRRTIVRHELGHAFGFWHTDNPADLMFANPSTCDALPSARERYHAAIAYARPIGNTDPDNDPAGTVNLRPLTAR